jgi:hypothetical protein
LGIDDDLNLYAYVRNDPVNLVDPEGEAAQAPAGAAIGFGLNIAQQLLEGKEFFGEGEEEIDWDEAVIDAAIGATGFGLGGLVRKAEKVAKTWHKKKKMKNSWGDNRRRSVRRQNAEVERTASAAKTEFVRGLIAYGTLKTGSEIYKSTVSDKPEPRATVTIEELGQPPLPPPPPEEVRREY